ncbi:hypothetical protein NVP1271B_33 [Vibrio phage 1.271.B._10N.286.54.B4]|nr:hypothetical protein NVP1027O_33 [Vibrio phage 1.027.O._10N.286.54.B8]AUR92360.1 hypothetical protein NVP1171O_33 [Vibrio phage 1.171.O._10N.261.52.F12]AUR94413.1 hypothetical protein NVP1194O_33 [Vibrio phage 1.194.O._10N.286.54.B1]AUR94498.1 hypothetical protein NVP1195O_33 [Vibrio phage 1.195.O._10N.286.54.C8]AUR94586.1 hypothetical protein NVP1196O_33 [Vibrio phage 1.196.O._10N.286.54.E12]AUR95053.1 hypothetical protein NVP1200O_33 [Vibrio phage 1.200.O._10N.286.55.E1]AUR99541.1 hypoth
MKNTDGFYASAKAFDHIASMVADSDKVGDRELIFKGYSFKLDDSLDNLDIKGVGHPYALIANMMQACIGG